MAAGARPALRAPAPSSTARWRAIASRCWSRSATSRTSSRRCACSASRPRRRVAPSARRAARPRCRKRAIATATSASSTCSTRSAASCATAARRCRCVPPSTRAPWRWCERSAAAGINIPLMKLILFALAALAASCTAVAFDYFDPKKPHRTASGFQNNYPHAEKGGFWRWKWQQWRDGLPQRPPEGYRFETAKADLSTNPSVTWVGHATVLLRIGGINVLTDPHFSERASPLSFAGPKRVVRAVPALAELPHIDAVVVSHNHYDHLDLESVAKLAGQAGGSPRFFVPLGLKDWFAQQGIDDVVELDW